MPFDSDHNEIQIEREPCKWCGVFVGRPCDCEDRIACSKAGEPGHRICGKCPHDLPRFATCKECET